MEPSSVFRPGDVVLTRSRGFVAGLNRLAQVIATGHAAQFTHAAICLTPDVLLDARPFVHIKLRSIFDLIRTEELDVRAGTGDVLVLRNTALTSTYEDMDSTGETLVLPLFAQLRKRYNWIFLYPQSSDNDPNSDDAKRAFCSELCVILLRYLDVLPKAWKASRTLPNHFPALLNLGWVDVTDAWRDQLQSLRFAMDEPNSERGRLVLPREKGAELYIRETEGWVDLHAHAHELTAELNSFLDSEIAATGLKTPPFA